MVLVLQLHGTKQGTLDLDESLIWIITSKNTETDETWHLFRVICK